MISTILASTNSFNPKAIKEWNDFHQQIVDTNSLDLFEEHLNTLLSMFLIFVTDFFFWHNQLVLSASTIINKSKSE